MSIFRSPVLALLTLGSALALACSTSSNNTGNGSGNTGGSGGRGGSAGKGSGGAGGSGSGGSAGGSMGGSSGGSGGSDNTAGAGGTGGSAGTGGAGGDAGTGAPDDAGSGGTGGGVDAAAGGDDMGGGSPSTGTHAKIVHLDTTATGAGVMADVPKYPVAVVLNATNFDFTQAKSQGEDIRFTTTGGQALPFEIEFWDATAKVASLWVKVDVKGNDNTQSFKMTWGDPNATSASNPKAVFDVADGFVGVWHLSEAGSMTAGGYKDATMNAADATAVGKAAPTTAAGRIGNAVSLAHASGQFLQLTADKSALYEDGTKMTYSIWSNAKTHTVEYQGIFTKSENGFRIHYYGLPSWTENHGRNIIEVCIDDSGNEDDCPLKGGNNAAYMGEDVKPGTWFHITAVANQPKWGYYINGVAQGEDNVPAPWRVAKDLVSIGTNTTQGASRSFDGVLDEARIIKVAKDANWIKLEYESQKDGQKFLSFTDN